MALTNYQKGRAKEYRLKKKYESKGYIVLRTAGSYGFADLIAINLDKRIIIFIQVKPRKFSKKAKERLMKKYDWINNYIFICKFEVI